MQCTIPALISKSLKKGVRNPTVAVRRAGLEDDEFTNLKLVNGVTLNDTIRN